MKDKNTTSSQHDAKLPVIRWKAFSEQKPPLFTTVCMCYNDGRLDGGVFNSKDEIRMWEESYKPVAWFIVPLPSFLQRGAACRRREFLLLMLNRIKNDQ